MEDDLMVCKVETLAANWHERLQAATEGGDNMQILQRAIFNGWPVAKHDAPEEVKPYWDVRDLLSSYNGVVFKGEHVVIPQSLKQEILIILHNSHSGMVTTKRRARDLVYWPGINKAIDDMISKCEICLQKRPAQQKEPMIIHPMPALPWNKLGTDLFEYDGDHYLLKGDYYSNFIEVVALHQDTTSGTVTRQIKANTARYGVMETLITDNRP